MKEKRKVYNEQFCPICRTWKPLFKEVSKQRVKTCQECNRALDREELYKLYASSNNTDNNLAPRQVCKIDPDYSSYREISSEN